MSILGLDDFLAFVKKADERLDRLEAGTPIKQSLTLSADGWTNDSGDEEYPYQYRLGVVGVTEASVANATLDEASQELAGTCGLSDETQTEAGIVVFKSAAAPSGDLTGVLDITLTPRTYGA